MRTILANPRFSALLTDFRTTFSVTPFESALLDALEIIVANSDLLVDPATLTAVQIARIPNVRSALLGNPAIVQLRLTGDALRAQLPSLQCNVLDGINHNQPLNTFLPIQNGSVFSDGLALANSSALQNVQQTVKGALTGGQAQAFLAAQGFLLAASLPQEQLLALQLAGPIPVSFLKTFLNVVGGAVIGAGLGFITGGPVGAAVGAVAGGIVGGLASSDSAGCDPCNQGCSVCNSGCCFDPTPNGMTSFLRVDFFNADEGCTSQSCAADTDCGASAQCRANCCQSPVDACPGNHCSADSDCAGLNTCQYGCCSGPCGIGGITCNVAALSSCGVEVGCPSGESCVSGCCLVTGVQ